jgi:hypothetical protein
MKIYALMLVIATIIALSDINLRQWATGRQA